MHKRELRVPTQRIALFRWSILFFIGNIFLFWLIGLSSLNTLSWVDTTSLSTTHQFIIKTFTVLSYMGQFGILALLPCALLAPLILLVPRRPIIFFIAILITSISVFLLVIDLSTFKLYRFHLNSTILDLAVNGLQDQVWQISLVEKLILMGIIAAFLILEALYAFILWRYLLDKKFFSSSLKWVLILICILCLFSSYAILLLTSGSQLNRVLVNITRTYPLYADFFNVLFPFKNLRVAMNRLPAQYSIEPQNNTVKYPLQKVLCLQKNKPKNLIIIVIDTWRHDMLTPDVAPNIYRFAQKSWAFNDHISGGNATAPGIFSLFYGLPASYWNVMKSQQRGPVFIHELLNQHYQMGIFASATLKLPAFNRTIFADIKNLREESPGKTPDVRDTAITKEFKAFIAKAVKKPDPIFGFLFYDSAHSYCGFRNKLKKFSPIIKSCNHMNLTNQSDPAPYLNRYKNAVFSIDLLVSQVLETLKTNHLLENTVVVITGDHGEEFNDNHEGYWGHASNFSRPQVQTPLIVYWPHENPKTFSHKTTHFDVVPTLMQSVLGCQSPASFYSIGKNLFEPNHSPYLFVGSYTGYGIIEPNAITNISPSGNYFIQDISAKPNPEADIDYSAIKKVFTDIDRFY